MKRVKRCLNWPLVMSGMLLPFSIVNAANVRMKPPEHNVVMTGICSFVEAAHSMPQQIISSIGVELTRVPAGYWVGKYPVTQEQYFKVIGNNPSRWRGENRPVENVDWDEAVAYCEKLTEIDIVAGIIPKGWRYSLPAEAQWEYFVADAGIDDMVYGRWEGLKPLGTLPVGSLYPNKFGLYDVLGNVWEWCSDWWGDNQVEKVLKGGAWDIVGAEAIDVSSCRPVSAAVSRDGNIGFRVVLQGK